MNKTILVLLIINLFLKKNNINNLYILTISSLITKLIINKKYLYKQINNIFIVNKIKNKIKEEININKLILNIYIYKNKIILIGNINNTKNILKIKNIIRKNINKEYLIIDNILCKKKNKFYIKNIINCFILYKFLIFNKNINITKLRIIITNDIIYILYFNKKSKFNINSLNIKNLKILNI